VNGLIVIPLAPPQALVLQVTNIEIFLFKFNIDVASSFSVRKWIMSLIFVDFMR
jgi:hypothetical protein